MLNEKNVIVASSTSNWISHPLILSGKHDMTDCNCHAEISNRIAVLKEAVTVKQKN